MALGYYTKTWGAVTNTRIAGDRYTGFTYWSDGVRPHSVTMTMTMTMEAIYCQSCTTKTRQSYKYTIQLKRQQLSRSTMKSHFDNGGRSNDFCVSSSCKRQVYITSGEQEQSARCKVDNNSKINNNGNDDGNNINDNDNDDDNGNDNNNNNNDDTNNKMIMIIIIMIMMIIMMMIIIIMIIIIIIIIIILTIIIKTILVIVIIMIVIIKMIMWQ